MQGINMRCWNCYPHAGIFRDFWCTHGRARQLLGKLVFLTPKVKKRTLFLISFILGADIHNGTSWNITEQRDFTNQQQLIYIKYLETKRNLKSEVSKWHHRLPTYPLEKLQPLRPRGFDAKLPEVFVREWNTSLQNGPLLVRYKWNDMPPIHSRKSINGVIYNPYKWVLYLVGGQPS